MRSMRNVSEQAGHGPDPVDIHVGKQLRYLRISRRMSQERIGAMVDLTFQQIQKYEKGTNRISASVLYHLARALEDPVAASEDGAPLIEGLLATASELKQLQDEEVRTALANLIRALARSRPRRTG